MEARRSGKSWYVKLILKAVDENTEENEARGINCYCVFTLYRTISASSGIPNSSRIISGELMNSPWRIYV